MTALGLRGVVGSLVDDRVGVVSYLREQKRQPEDPDFFRFVARAASTQAFCAQDNFSFAGGAAANREAAALKAVGEAVERYCAAQYIRDDFPLARASDAAFKCVDPGTFALYSPDQYASPGFPFVPFTEETAIRWLPAIELLGGEPVHLPACLVHIPYETDKAAGEQRFAQSISTGLALHSSFEKAAVSAICEVIERDAFTIVWQAMVAPPRILQASLSESNRDLIGRFEAVGDTVHLLDLTIDIGLCTILAVRVCESAAAPALSVAASTDLDPEIAIRKSLEELAHTSRYMWAIKAGLPWIPAEPGHPRVGSQVTHLQYWQDSRALREAEFLWSNPEERRFEELPNLARGDAAADLQTVLALLHRLGKRTFLVDLTTPDIADLGLTVVRAVVPGLHPLAMGYSLRALGGDRLWTVPQKLGYAGLARGASDNPSPHPYP